MSYGFGEKQPPSDMLPNESTEVNVLDSVMIKDRGMLYIVESPYYFETHEQALRQFGIVIIDNKKYEIKGIERNCISWVSAGNKIGLLLEEIV